MGLIKTAALSNGVGRETRSPTVARNAAEVKEWNDATAFTLQYQSQAWIKEEGNANALVSVLLTSTTITTATTKDINLSVTGGPNLK